MQINFSISHLYVYKLINDSGTILKQAMAGSDEEDDADSWSDDS